VLQWGYIGQIGYWPDFAFPQTDLSHCPRVGYVECCVVVEDGKTNLELRDLLLEVPGH
jgi:hypothetical protein